MSEIKSTEFDQYCTYWTAVVERSKVWLLVGVLKNEQNVCLERCLDSKESIFEFFVPESTLPEFVRITNRLAELGVIYELKRAENRLFIDANP